MTTPKTSRFEYSARPMTRPNARNAVDKMAVDLHSMIDRMIKAPDGRFKDATPSLFDALHLLRRAEETLS